jgi:phage terminase small subunit
VREFVAGRPGVRGVAIRAAEAAGYSLRDMGIGAQLVRTPSVKAAIARHFAKWDLKAQDVIDELRRVGFSDVRSFVEWDGSAVTLRPSDELTDDDAAAVAEVSQTVTKDGGTVRFRLHDKLAALGLLAKFLGVVDDRVTVTGRGGGPIELSTYVYLPTNGREFDPGQVRAEPVEVADFRALPAARDAAVDPSLARAGIALPASGRNGTP